MSRETKAQRRKLVNNYKDTPKKMGVYCIRNRQNNQCLVASSLDLEARINRHQFELRNNSERVSTALQSQWNTFGADAFEFTILDVLEPSSEPGYQPAEDLAILEAACRDQLEDIAPFV